MQYFEFVKNINFDNTKPYYLFIHGLGIGLVLYVLNFNAFGKQSILCIYYEA